MSKIPLGPAELGGIALYLFSLIGIGYWGMRARKENSLKDFYLAGSGVGFMVLVLTLYRRSTAVTRCLHLPVRLSE